MKIIVDAMGGDNAPLEIVKGCAQAVNELGVEIILCGNEALIKNIIRENNISDKGFSYEDTGDRFITMEDHAESVVKSKKDSSLAVAFKLLSQKAGDAVVSAGNTGAVLVGATLIVKRLSGIKRPAIGSVLPTQTGTAFLIDCGANAECKPEYLEQFAIMGSTYMNKIMGVEAPRVGLLNNGSENTKGTPMHIEANTLLSQNTDINFAGNIEGRNAPLGAADVIVADGFSGNIFLKTFEGVGSLFLKSMKNVFYASLKTKLAALILKKTLKSFLKQYDYKEYGGAAVLGVKGIVIKAHGSSDARAFKNAVRQATLMEKSNVIGVIEKGFSKNN